MPSEINYDEAGKPKTVLITYEDYRNLLAKPDERAIISQTASRISELVQQFARDADLVDSDDERLIAEEMSPRNFELQELPSDERQKPAPADVRRYKNATGYYDGHGFRVLKGSKASGYPSPTFDKLEAAATLRKNLIQGGILARDGDWGDYTFTQDYLFSSASAAACIVDGNSRSGPGAWGRRRPSQHEV